ncbi:hypothetical protein MLD38_024647 [Melastoma candidum]|uniref:Uncharacterized protein n=1 Tax=Melastoma candidum TaxID=119954 RepID=A0ACB9NUA1_9MYRT|nr:hypothetical protein MLD38_024647 [Melastoma candidum]
MTAYSTILVPAFVVSLVFLATDWVSLPSCGLLIPIGGHPRVVDPPEGSQQDLRVMLVGDLLLSGDDSSFLDSYFRDYYLSQFFRKSFQALKPDMLVFLGDVSARGWKLTRKQWVSVIRQFNRIIGAYVGIPFHVVLGDKDIGNCSGLDAQFVSWVAGRFPGLDSAGCGAFEMNNVAFISLNSVALMCGDCALRFGIEQAIEREKYALYEESLGSSNLATESYQSAETSLHPPWRQNSMPPGSGPVLLLHLPLHMKGMRNYAHGLQAKGSDEQLRSVGPMPYELSQSIPPNATTYIFQALRPRIVFSGHRLQFGNYIHDDRTHEVTVPSMSWADGGTPGFVLATFQNGSAIGISHCSHTKEAHVLSLMFLLLMMILIILAKEYRELRILQRTMVNHICLAIFS